MNIGDRVSLDKYTTTPNSTWFGEATIINVPNEKYTHYIVKMDNSGLTGGFLHEHLTLLDDDGEKVFEPQPAMFGYEYKFEHCRADHGGYLEHLKVAEKRANELDDEGWEIMEFKETQREYGITVFARRAKNV